MLNYINQFSYLKSQKAPRKDLSANNNRCSSLVISPAINMHCGINKLLERGAFGQTIHGMVESLSYWTGKILNPVIQSITCHTNSLLDQWLIKVWQLAYVAYVHMPTFIGVRMILGIRTLTRTLIFFLWFYKVLKTFLVLITLYCLKAYCCIFDL